MLKIRLTATNKYLSLSPDTTVRIVLRSPFYFADGSDYGAEIMPTGFTFPFTIPLVGSNLSALNFPNAIQGAYSFSTDIHCEIRVSDALILPGVLNVRSATRTTAEVDITVNIIPELKETLLNELDLGSIDLAVVNPITRANATVSSPDDYDYIFSPVWNPSCRTETSPANFDGSSFQNMYDGSGLSFEISNGSALTPHPKVGFVLKKIFEQDGFMLNANIFKEAELKWLLLYSAQTLCDETGNVFSGVKNIAYGLPTIKVSEFLRNLCRRFCCAPFIDFFNRTVNLYSFSNLIKRNSSIDWTSYALLDYNIEIDRTYPQYFKDSKKESIIPQELSQYTQYSGVPLTYNAAEGIYTNSNNPRYHKDLNGTTYTQETEVELENYKKVDGGVGEYENSINPLPESHAWFNTTAVRFCYMPSVRQKCYYTEPDYTIDTARIFLFRGFRNNALNHVYPYSSSDIIDIDSATVNIGWDVDPLLGLTPPAGYGFTKFAAARRLWWSGNNGQFAQFWNDNIEFIKQQKIVRRPMMPTLRAIMQTKFEDKIRIKSQLYFIKELDFVITASGTLKSCDATLITTF